LDLGAGGHGGVECGGGISCVAVLATVALSYIGLGECLVRFGWEPVVGEGASLSKKKIAFV